MARKIYLLFILLLLFVFTSCVNKNSEMETSPQRVTVTIIPQQYLIKQIADTLFEVQVLLPPGSNHETYEPTPRDMEKISGSSAYFILGALDFELAWLDRFKAANHRMITVNTSEGIELLGGHTHQHAGRQTGNDPHIWLSPACMKIQAQNICQALSKIDTAHAAFFKNNLIKFEHLADSIDKQIRQNLAGSQKKAFMIFHPALGYFARDYGLEQISMEQEGKEPSPAYLEQLVELAKNKGITSIFISKEFDTRHAEAIAKELNAKIVIFDPMREDWDKNLIHLSQLIAEN